MAYSPTWPNISPPFQPLPEGVLSSHALCSLLAVVCLSLSLVVTCRAAAADIHRIFSSSFQRDRSHDHDASCQQDGAARPDGRTFSATATGSNPLTYQWQRNRTAISGATSASYTTPAATTTDDGAQFQVVVSNSTGSATSNPATLTVSSTPSPAPNRG